MRVSIESMNRSIVVFVLFLALGTHCFGGNAGAPDSTTKASSTTAMGVSPTMNPHVPNSCDDFYHHACDNNPFFSILDTWKTQEQYHSNRLQMYISNYTTWKPKSSRSPRVQMMREFKKLCKDRKKVTEVGVEPIVRFLRTVPYGNKSWWELENWAVVNGFNSTFFSAEFLELPNTKDRQGSIVLDHPDSWSIQEDYINTCKRVISKLCEAGLDVIKADRLSEGVTKEKQLYSIIANPDGYSGLPIRGPISTWRELWNSNRTIASNLTQNDWEHYLHGYWNSVITGVRGVPLLKTAFMKIFIGPRLSVAKLGSAVEQFTDNNMKNIILWRMVIQLLDYAGKKARDGLQLPFTQPCFTPAMESALKKGYWQDIIPTSKRTLIKRIYSEVDLQLKLLTYKSLIKMPMDMEPLTPREKKRLDRLVNAPEDMRPKVNGLKWNLDESTGNLTEMKNMKDPTPCVMVSNDACYRATQQYARYQKEIPELEERVKKLKVELEQKSAELNRSTTHLEDFRAKNRKRISVDFPWQERTLTFRDFLVFRTYPNFPFENTFSRLKMELTRFGVHSDYVELGLLLKKWKRAMLLQLPDIFDLRDNKDEKLTMNGLPDSPLSRLSTNGNSLVNYGSLGSALGNEISLELRRPVIDAKYVRRLQTYIKSDTLKKPRRRNQSDADWRKKSADKLGTFINATLPGVNNWMDMPSLLSAFDEFLKQHRELRMHNAPNVDQWLVTAYKVANTGIGLKAAWNARQRYLRRREEDGNGHRDRPEGIPDEFNETMLFFIIFTFTNCEARNSTTAKTVINTIMKSDPVFSEEFRNKTTCFPPRGKSPEV